MVFKTEINPLSALGCYVALQIKSGHPLNKEGALEAKFLVSTNK